MNNNTSIVPSSASTHRRLIIAPDDAPVCSAGRRQSKSKRSGALPHGVVKSDEVENVFTCNIDSSALAGVRAVVSSLLASLRSSSGSNSTLGSGGSCKLTFKPKKLHFHAERPNWKSDIRWVSAGDEATLGFFQALFDKLKIAASFSFLGTKMVLYSGFFVLRQSTRKSHFHTDFGDTGNKAYTLMTPLEDMSDLTDCHLLAKLRKLPKAPRVPPVVDLSCEGGSAASGGDASSGTAGGTASGAAGDGASRTEAQVADADNEASSTADDDADGTAIAADGYAEEKPFEYRQYRYECGRGIAFGDGFVHATETGDSPRPLAFLCFTFGDASLTDAQWRSAEAYISQQGPWYKDPKGAIVASAAFASSERSTSSAKGATAARTAEQHQKARGKR